MCERFVDSGHLLTCDLLPLLSSRRLAVIRQSAELFPDGTFERLDINIHKLWGYVLSRAYLFGDAQGS